MTWKCRRGELEWIQRRGDYRQALFRFFYPQSAPADKMERELEQARTDGRFDEEGWRLRKDGTLFWAGVTITPMQDAQGNLCGYSKIIRDLTEQKQMMANLQQAHDDLEQRVEERTAELTQTYTALQEKEESLRLLIDSVQDHAIFSLDAEGCITSWNVGTQRLKGYTREEILGQHFSVFYTQEDKAEGKPARALATALRMGKFEEEYWRVRKDGSLFWGHVIITPIWDTKGRLLRYSKVTHDITERKAAQEEQRRSEARFRATFEQAAVGIAHVSLNGGWIDVNSKLCAILGYSREELSALTFQDITHPEDLDADLTNMAQVLAGEIVTYSMEKRYLHKDGSCIWINLTVALVRDLDGKPEYFLSIVEDISTRNQVQEALRDSEARYRFLADSMPQIVWTTEPDGNVDYFNQRWCDYTGMTLDETRGWHWGTVLHTDDLQNCVEIWTRSLTTGNPYEVEYRFKRAFDGMYRWHLGRGLPRRNAAGEIIQWVGTCTDIDDFKQTQTALMRLNEELETRVNARTAELARSNTELEQFAYVASHDLQEPLRMIGSYLELLNLEYAERLDDDAREYIAYAVDGAVRMKALINDLLAFSRVATQGKPMEPTDVSSLLLQVLADLQLLIAETGAVITCDPLPCVVADGSQVRLVLQNLIGNAIKFRSDAAPRLHVSATEVGGEWQFAVSDNGIGMKAKHLERIFVIFQRLHNKSKYAGTGIGLAVCKRVVERHGGRIWVQSEPGQGSTFFFTLPQAPNEQNVERDSQEDTLYEQL